MSASVITGPGIYQMRNGDFVAVTNRLGNGRWSDFSQRSGWLSDGFYWGGDGRCPFDIIRRVSDLPAIEEVKP